MFKMFLDRGLNFGGLKTPTYNSIHLCRGWLHTAHTIAKIDKVKDLALIFWKVSLVH